jgi:anti-anti-sigma factor
MTMAVSLHEQGGCTLVLQGVVDIFEARELHQQAMAALGAGGEVTLDLEEVDRLDSSAIQILVALRQSLAAGGRSLRLEGIPPSVHDTWRLLGLGASLLQ